MAQLLKNSIYIFALSTLYTQLAFAKVINKTTPTDKNYIEFQVYGTTIFEGDNVNQSQNTNDYKNLAYTLTNVDIDFNFNKNFGIATQTNIQNRQNGINRTQATLNYVNSTNQTSFLFQNTGITTRILALHLHNRSTSLLIGKIRPSSGVASGLDYNIIQQDWYGLYGTMLNGGYANGNKIGAQFNTSFSIMPHSKQYLEVAVFQNDTSLLNEPMLSNYGVFGYAIPSSLQGIVSTNQAGNTSSPSSFSILGINDSELLDNQKLSYSLYYRKNDINKTQHTFLQPETTTSGSISYTRQYEAIKLGGFANIALVDNSYGLSGLNENYYTASAYVDIDSFIIVYAYNLYKMNGSENFANTGNGIPSQTLSQNQISFGYRFNNAYKIDIAYRQIKDEKTNKNAQGVGLGIKYNIGTKY